MKKLLAGAGAVALAAMPMVGAFADVTDTVVLTIKGACSVGSSTSSTGGGTTMTEANATNNQLYEFAANGTAGGVIKVSCNDASGWHVKAVGASTGSSNTSMTPTGSGTAIATGTATSGATSNWAFKVAGSSPVTVVSGYANYAAVPATAAKVASGDASISEGTINTGYQVWVSATQQADTYTGKVTYTVATGTGS